MGAVRGNCYAANPPFLFFLEKIICRNEPEAMKSGDEEFPLVGKYPIYQLCVPSLFPLRRPHLAKLHKCCS